MNTVFLVTMYGTMPASRHLPEEDAREVRDVVQRVVVGHDRVEVVHDASLVHLDRVAAALGDECGGELTFPDDLVPRGVLASDGVTLEEDGLLVAELDAVDVDGVAADGDAVPAAAHGAVWGSPSLL